MNTRPKVLIVTLVLGVLAFLAEPNGPLGAFWAPDPTVPQAVGAQVPLFIALGGVEALALGLGVAFLLFGYSAIQTGTSKRLARAAHLSIAWFLMNWWAHDSLHLHIGFRLNALLAVEYGFHFTLIIAGVILARFFLAVARAPAQVSA